MGDDSAGSKGLSGFAGSVISTALYYRYPHSNVYSLPAALKQARLQREKEKMQRKPYA
jgi:hypothetical protein